MVFVLWLTNERRLTLFPGESIVRDRKSSTPREQGCVVVITTTPGWSTVGTWFGIYSAPGTRMQACGLVYLLFVAQIMWFGLFDVCNAKAEWVEQSVRGHEICIDEL